MIDNNVSPIESKIEDLEGNTPAQSQKGRNTNMCRGGKGMRRRAWAFTLNGYKPKNICTLEQRKFIFRKKEMTISRYLFQEEMTEGGTRHLQRCLYFTHPVSFDCVKSLLPRGHIEPARNWHALLNYSSKKFTRNGRIYRYGCQENRIRVIESPEEEEDRWAAWRWREQERITAGVMRSLRGMNFDV